MYLTTKKIIDKRKSLWRQSKDIEQDKEYRETIAEFLVSMDGSRVRKEIEKNPEKLIEMFFVIVNKEQQTVPFFLNAVQKELIKRINADIKLFKEGKKLHLKYLLLKGRQQGMTSFISAYQLARAITHKNFSSYTLADNADNTEVIFTDKAKFYFDNLPGKIKPSIKYSSRKELDFSREDGGGMNSKWRVATAGNIDAGRSRTLNFFHGSEVAFWKDAKHILVGLSEAFTKNAIVILETTANGFNEYKELWDGDNTYDKLFFEWWKTKEYVLNFEDNKTEQAFIEKIETAEESSTDDADLEPWIWHRLYWLKKTKRLTLQQLYWYYNKWKDKRSSIKQEYPCSAEEAFLATGKNYFNIEIVARRYAELQEQYKKNKPVKGYFTYKYGVSSWTGEKIIVDDSIQFVEDNDIGYITLYDTNIPKTEPYTLGGDTAGEGSDWNVAHVLNTRQEQTATIRLQKDEDLFADQLYCLGKMFNDALIAVEVNFSTYVTNTLVNREYPNLYVRENAPDNISKQLVKKYGFNTNKITRPAMLGKLKTLVRERPECIRDIDTLREMFTFIIDEHTKPIAIEGEHDDCILSLAIALYVQDQQVDEIKLPLNKLEGFYLDEELKDMGYTEWEIKAYRQGYPLYRK